MWTTENRGRYDRSKLRYPSDLTDDEWALVASLAVNLLLHYVAAAPLWTDVLAEWIMARTPSRAALSRLWPLAEPHWT